MPKNQFKKRILVTGGAGFIGSNYLNMFVRRYPEYLFINVDCLTYAGQLSNLTVEREKNYRFEKVDICDAAALESLFKRYAPTACIHFAAESHVDFSIHSPARFVQTNILGTHNLLRLAREYKLERFHQISTDEVYGSLSARAEAFTENSPLQPNSPYSASKASADMLVRSYHATYGLNTVISRSSNNFGPQQDQSKLMPKCISQFLNRAAMPVYKDGKNIRDWIFVDDHVEAIDRIFHYGKNGEVYNVGAGEERSNLQIAKSIFKVLGKKGPPPIQFVADRPGHDFRYAVSTKKIEKELGWHPRFSFDEALQSTVQWYKQHLHE